MLNHLRTLLLNAPPASLDELGEEFVPAGYKTLTLPTYLNRFRATLFGSDPDRAYINFRLQQCMMLLHISELVSYVTDLDPRITYWPSERNDFLAIGAKYSHSFSAIGNTPSGTAIALQGNPVSLDSVGRIRQRWLLTINGLSLEIKELQPPFDTASVSFTIIDGLSSAISIPKTRFYVRIPETSAISNYAWQLEILTRPQLDLGDVTYNLDRLGGPEMDQLLGIDNEEPYKTLRTLWSTRRELGYHLGALLVAAAYRIESVRRKS